MKFHFDRVFCGERIVFDWEDGVVSGPDADWALELESWAGMRAGDVRGLWGYDLSDDPVKNPYDMAAILMSLSNWTPHELPVELEPYFKPVYDDSPQFNEHGEEIIY